MIEPVAGGKFLVAGTTDGFGFGPTLARLNADGSHDTTFGNGDGIADDGHGVPVSHDGMLQGDGKLVIVGGGSGVSGAAIGVYRFNADGSGDAGFGADGLVTIPPPAGFVVWL